MRISRESTITPCSFFIPHIRFYDEPDDLLCMPGNPIKHLSAQCTWKGISSLHAEELSRWHTAFMNILEEKLQPILLDKDFHEGFPMNLNVAKLAIAVLDRLDNEIPLEGSMQSVANIAHFIRLRNCWLPVSPSHQHNPRIGTLRVSESSIQLISRRIIFEDFVLMPYEGQNYYLKPRYIPSFNVSELSAYSPRILYETPGTFWLAYKGGRFHGAVPRCRSGVLHVLVRATITHNFPLVSGCSFLPRHEEVIAVRVTILPVVLDTRVYCDAAVFNRSGCDLGKPLDVLTKPSDLEIDTSSDWETRPSDYESEPVSPNIVPQTDVDLDALVITSTTDNVDTLNLDMSSLELSNPFAILDGHSDMDESVPPRKLSFNKPDEMDRLVKMACKSSTDESQPPRDAFKKDCDSLLSPHVKDLQMARDTVCEMLLISINLAGDDCPYKEVWILFREHAIRSSNLKLLNLCRDLLLDYYFDIESSSDAETYMFLRRAFKMPAGGRRAKSSCEKDLRTALPGDVSGARIEAGLASPARSEGCSQDALHSTTNKLLTLKNEDITDQNAKNLLKTPDDDGITDENVERVRCAVASLDLGSEEDPRDVREMKKALLGSELRSLEEGMLGRRVNRWIGDLGACSDCSDCSFGSSAMLPDIPE